MIVDARANRVTLYGELNNNQWLTIKAAATLLLKRNPSGIIISCSGLEGLTPEGATTFLHAQNYIQNNGARIVFCEVPTELLPVLRSTPGLRSQLHVTKTLEEALASLGEGHDDVEEVDVQRHEACAYTVLLPLWDELDIKSLTDHSQHLAKDYHGMVKMVYMLVVPQKLSIDAPLPEEEENANVVLDRLKLQAKSAKVRCEIHVHRCRNLTTGLLKLASTEKPEIMVLGIPKNNDGGFELSEILAKAPCEVMVSKSKNTTEPTTER